MYVPASFQENDVAEIRRLIRSHAFATLVSWDGSRPVATHLVLVASDEPDGSLVLSGHMSRANPQWRGFRDNTEVLAIFHGPHTYVSPTWYTEPGVPTWNYQVVHAHGIPRLVEDPAEVRTILTNLVERFEDVYRLSGLPDGHVEKTMRGVVGFRIPVTRLEAASKLSQNKGAQDYRTVIRELELRQDADSRAIAREMRRRDPEGSP